MEKRYETIWLERVPERGLQHVHTENVQRVIRNTQRATSNKQRNTQPDTATNLRAKSNTYAQQATQHGNCNLRASSYTHHTIHNKQCATNKTIRKGVREVGKLAAERKFRYTSCRGQDTFILFARFNSSFSNETAVLKTARFSPFTLQANRHCSRASQCKHTVVVTLMKQRGCLSIAISHPVVNVFERHSP